MTHAANWRIALTFAIACLFLNEACAHTPAHDADHAGQENMSPEELEAELKKVQEEVRILGNGCEAQFVVSAIRLSI
jgi:hypothetical protein